MSRCPRCSEALESPLACLACGTLLPFPAETTALDAFAVFGAERKYSVDVDELRRKLLRYSRLTHPDFFATATSAEKERAERATAMLNSAFAVLSDDAARADALIAGQGGPDENAERTMPKEFLMEVLEWNETLEEARHGASIPAERLDALRSELETRREKALSAVSKLLDPLPPRGDAALREARRALNVVRYVDRARSELEALRLSRAEVR